MKRLTILLMLLLGLCAGCGYGEVSPKSYEIAKSLYNITNRQLTDRLEIITVEIETAEEKNEISPKEAKWLCSIVKRAEQEQWQKAMKESRQMMEDQIAN